MLVDLYDVAVKEAVSQIVSVFAEGMKVESVTVRDRDLTWCGGGGHGTVNVESVEVESYLTDVGVSPAYLCQEMSLSLVRGECCYLEAAWRADPSTAAEVGVVQRGGPPTPS